MDGACKMQGETKKCKRSFLWKPKVNDFLFIYGLCGYGVKGKGKDHLRTGHEGPEGEQRCSCTLSLTSARVGVVWGGVVVKALRYQSDGPGIDSWWCHWIFQ